MRLLERAAEEIEYPAADVTVAEVMAESWKVELRGVDEGVVAVPRDAAWAFEHVRARVERCARHVPGGLEIVERRVRRGGERERGGRDSCRKFHSVHGWLELSCGTGNYDTKMT